MYNKNESKKLILKIERVIILILIKCYQTKNHIKTFNL